MLERGGKKTWHPSIFLLRISCNAQWLQSLYKVCAVQCSTKSVIQSSHIWEYSYFQRADFWLSRGTGLCCVTNDVSAILRMLIGVLWGWSTLWSAIQRERAGVSHLFGLLPCLMLLGKELKVQLLLLLLVVLLQLDRKKERKKERNGF